MQSTTCSTLYSIDYMLNALLNWLGFSQSSTCSMPLFNPLHAQHFDYMLNTYSIDYMLNTLLNRLHGQHFIKSTTCSTLYSTDYMLNAYVYV